MSDLDSHELGKMVRDLMQDEGVSIKSEQKPVVSKSKRSSFLKGGSSLSIDGLLSNRSRTLSKKVQKNVDKPIRGKRLVGMDVVSHGSKGLENIGLKDTSTKKNIPTQDFGDEHAKIINSKLSKRFNNKTNLDKDNRQNDSTLYCDTKNNTDDELKSSAYDFHTQKNNYSRDVRNDLDFNLKPVQKNKSLGSNHDFVAEKLQKNFQESEINLNSEAEKTSGVLESILGESKNKEEPQKKTANTLRPGTVEDDVESRTHEVAKEAEEQLKNTDEKQQKPITLADIEKMSHSSDTDSLVVGLRNATAQISYLSEDDIKNHETGVAKSPFLEGTKVTKRPLGSYLENETTKNFTSIYSGKVLHSREKSTKDLTELDSVLLDLNKEDTSSKEKQGLVSGLFGDKKIEEVEEFDEEITDIYQSDMSSEFVNITQRKKSVTTVVIVALLMLAIFAVVGAGIYLIVSENTL